MAEDTSQRGRRTATNQKIEKANRRPRYLKAQMVLAFVLAAAGLAVLAIGLYAPPMGEIHSSVLIAYGEISTFAGSMLGVVYHADYKYMVKSNELQKIINQLKKGQ